MTVVAKDVDGSRAEDARVRQPTASVAQPSASCLVTALAAASAAWVSAGSVGLLGLPLRHALAWLLLGAAVLCCRWSRSPAGAFWWRALLAAAAIVVMSASSLMPVNALAAGLVLAILAGGCSGADRRVLLAAACGCAIFGLYRLGVTSVSWLWLAADTVGRAISRAGSLLTGRSLAVGPSFAGLDYLVLVASTWAAGLVLVGPRRSYRAIGGLIAIVLALAAWLCLLSQTLRLAEVVDPQAATRAWSWQGVLAAAFPWNVPALAVPIFLAALGWVLRSIRCSQDEEAMEAGRPHAGLADGAGAASGSGLARTALAVALAACLPAVATLSGGLGPLKDRKIVASGNVFGNWLRPEHGQYGRLSIGMYGMLYQYMESLGGRFSVSEHLTDEDLADASALLVIYPYKPWEPGQVDRILKFARDGGTVLVFGEHTILEDDNGQRFNDILQHTHMRVRFDTAEWAVGGWMQCLDAMAHPAFTGIPDDRFGLVIGASVEARWPARPLLVARWGFQDRGDPSNGLSKLDNQRYDPGEPLGDVVLAAEEPYGAGRIMAFGDTSAIINGINLGSHVFTSRLYSYIAGRDSATPQRPWRQAAAIALLAALAGVLLARPRPLPLGMAAAGAALSLAVCTAWSYRANEVLPDGRGFHPINRLAYIDDSHLEAFSGEAIREDPREGGLQGLTLTLMRSGYLTLMLPEFTPQRIERAGMILSIAPSRELTEDERALVRRFVDNGGTYILMVGYEEAGPSRRLLADFDFEIGSTLFGTGQVIEGQPRYMRYFKSPYTVASDGQFAHVRFQTAWPLINKGPKEGLRVFAYGPTLEGDLPIIAARYRGMGRFVVIADTYFAMNRNLESMDGSPIEGRRENAEFWRWFLAELTGVDPYVPTNSDQILPAASPPQAPALSPPAAPEPAPAEPQVPLSPAPQTGPDSPAGG